MSVENFFLIFVQLNMVQMPREDLIGKVFFAGAQVPMGVPDPYAQPPVAQPPAAPGKPSCTQHGITSVVCKRLSPCLFFECHMFLVYRNFECSFEKIWVQDRKQSWI